MKLWNNYFFKLWNNYFSLQLMMTTTQDHTSVTCVRSARSWDAAVDDAYQIRNSSWEVIAILGFFVWPIQYQFTSCPWISVCIVFWCDSEVLSLDTFILKQGQLDFSCMATFIAMWILNYAEGSQCYDTMYDTYVVDDQVHLMLFQG